MTTLENIKKDILENKHIYIGSEKIQRFTDIIPKTIRNKLLRSYFSKKFERYMQKRLRNFYIDINPYPVPLTKLIMQTSILTEKDIDTKTDPDFYLFNGYSQMLSWLKTLERYGFNIRTAGAIMELGCGTARLIRHLRCIDGINLVGTDLNGELIEWCSNNVPGIEFHKNNLNPPLEFAKDDTFDLVFAASVFTHIPLETQHLWIKELHRIIRPGGYLLCDVNGRYHQDRQLIPDQIDMLHKNGKFTLTSKDNLASLSTKIIESWDVFQTRVEILKVFRSYFIVEDYIPAGLDQLVLKKPE